VLVDKIDEMVITIRALRLQNNRNFCSCSTGTAPILVLYTVLETTTRTVSKIHDELRRLSLSMNEVGAVRTSVVSVTD
jgi:hypothetical protein